MTNLGALYDSVYAVFTVLRTRHVDGDPLTTRDLAAIIAQLRRAGVAAAACQRHLGGDDEDPAP